MGDSVYEIENYTGKQNVSKIIFNELNAYKREVDFYLQLKKNIYLRNSISIKFTSKIKFTEKEKNYL